MEVHRQTSVLPNIPPQIMADIFRTIRLRRTECWAEWVVKTSARILIDGKGQILDHLFSFILNHFEEIAQDEITFAEKLQMQFLRAQPTVTAEDVIFLLSSLESIVMSIMWRNGDITKIELAFQWVHAATIQLESTIIEKIYFPLQTNLALSTKEALEQPLVRFLNWFRIGTCWTWVAIIQQDSDIRIVDLALFNANMNQWHNASIDANLFQDVYETFAHSGGYRIQIASGLYLVAKGTPSDTSWIVFRQIVHLLEITSSIFGNLRDVRLRNDKLYLYETLLEIDEALIMARDAQKIFECTTSYVCQYGNFARGALFLYSPFTRSIEGMYSYNIHLDDIRRIRDNERNFPLLYHVGQMAGCVFYPDVTHKFPDHYVRQFQLTSLLVSPLLDNQNRPIGILLLDQAGKTFQPDERTISLVNAIVKRSAKVLSVRLFQSSSSKPAPIPSGRLTSREQEVLQCIADGMDTKDMASHLYISEHTVTEHVSSILKKLEAKNRPQAVAKGVREHLVV